MAKDRQGDERGGPVTAPVRAANQSEARELSAKSSEITSAAGHLLDALCLLGLSEAVLFEELSKRRGNESPPDHEITDRDRPTSDVLTRGVRDGRVRRVLDLIESQPSQSVQRLAREAGLCPDHLQRLFKQESGGGHLRELLGKRRLQKAAELLFASAMSIKEIAYAVGYKHHSSFVRAFEREFGRTPRHYRQGKGSPLTDAAKKILINVAFCINIAFSEIDIAFG